MLLSSAVVPGGYFAIHSGYVPDVSDCLRDAAALVLLSPSEDSASVTLSLLPETDGESAIRWTIDITPDVRAWCLALLKAEQAEAIRSIREAA